MLGFQFERHVRVQLLETAAGLARDNADDADAVGAKSPSISFIHIPSDTRRAHAQPLPLPGRALIPSRPRRCRRPRALSRVPSTDLVAEPRNAAGHHRAQLANRDAARCAPYGSNDFDFIHYLWGRHVAFLSSMPPHAHRTLSSTRRP